MTLAELTCALSRACAVPLAAAPCPNPSMGCAGPPSATHAGAEGAACLWRQLAASQREAADTYSGDRPAAVVLPLGCPNRVRSSAERRLHSMVAFSLGHSYPPSRFAGASEPPAVRSAPARSQSTARATLGQRIASVYVAGGTDVRIFDLSEDTAGGGSRLRRRPHRRGSGAARLGAVTGVPCGQLGLGTPSFFRSRS